LYQKDDLIFRLSTSDKNSYIKIFNLLQKKKPRTISPRSSHTFVKKSTQAGTV